MAGAHGWATWVGCINLYLPEWRSIRSFYFALDGRANCLDSLREHEVRAITQALIANKTAPCTAHAAIGTLARDENGRSSGTWVLRHRKVDTMGTQRGPALSSGTGRCVITVTALHLHSVVSASNNDTELRRRVTSTAEGCLLGLVCNHVME